jgi:adenylate cyclase
MTGEEHESNPQWQALLMGTHPGLRWARRMFKVVPATQHCKVCGSPQDGIGGPLMRLAGFGRYPRNPQLCNNCFRMSQRWPGGADIEVTSMFADIRGSTGMAESMPAVAYSAHVDDYVRAASRAIRAQGGIVQKLLGDGVLALFIPALSGGNTSTAALTAARRILGEVSLPVGIGVHTGPAWVGFVGGVDEVLDFTALGDSVNVASRLGSEAAAGELLMSASTAAAARVDTNRLTGRRLELRGRTEPLDAWVERVPNGVTAP